MKLNREFWEQVAYDYKDYGKPDINGNKLFTICGASKLFKEIWGSQRLEIRALGKEFLDYYCITDVDLGIGLNLLFVIPIYSYESNVEIRKNFLNFMINYDN